MEIDRLARIIWDYHRLNMPLSKADCIVVFGSRDVRPAVRAAELYLAGYAPLVVITGGHGRVTKTWKKSEAETFADIAVSHGVPREKIVLEDKSTNTGENIVFTKALLKERGLNPKKIIAVQKPYMERRIYLALRKQWPEVVVTVSSPGLSYDDYPNDVITRDQLIISMVSDLSKIIEYPAKGYQIAEDVPPDVLEAYKRLISFGYGEHVVS